MTTSSLWTKSKESVQKVRISQFIPLLLWTTSSTGFVRFSCKINKMFDTREQNEEKLVKSFRVSYPSALDELVISMVRSLRNLVTLTKQFNTIYINIQHRVFPQWLLLYTPRSFNSQKKHKVFQLYVYGHWMQVCVCVNLARLSVNFILYFTMFTVTHNSLQKYTHTHGF